MLVLSRKTSERIVVTVPGRPKIVITLVGAARGRARIGLEAAPEVEIVREELTGGKEDASCR